MSTHKHIDKICCIVLAFTLLITAIFMNGQNFGITSSSTEMGYESRLFDTSTVHTIDISMDNWEEFLANCTSEEYYDCTVTIDNESYKNVAIRGKGNTSLTQVQSYGNDRYSFKIEFDHYDDATTYHGLDKLCLNNIIQDNTYMKDYLTYQMMNEFGVASPLCSYAYITVNGEDFGLYLAVEGVEESFLQRNYGSNYGELYKPDSMSMGGGRGNGKEFNMDDIFGEDADSDASEDQTLTPGNGGDVAAPDENSADSGSATDSGDATDSGATTNPGGADGSAGTVPTMPEGMEMPEGMTMPEDGTMPDMSQMQQGGTTPDMAQMQQGGTTSDISQMQQGGAMPDMSQMPQDGMGQAMPGADTNQTNPDNNASDSTVTSEDDATKDSSAGAEDAPSASSDSSLPEMGNKGGQMGGFSMGSDDVLLKYIDEEFDSYSNIFDNAKTNVTDADKTRLIDSLEALSSGENLTETVDIEAVIRYFVVHNFVLNFDSYTGSMIHNYYLYENQGQLSMIPWDYNLAFGGFESGSDATSLANYPIDDPVSGDSVENRPMLAWIFSNEQYTELYHQYFNEFITKYFDSGYFTEMIDSVSEMISPYVEKDPTKFCTFEEFETGVSTLKEFCLLRAESISGQLDGTIGSTSETQDSETFVDASHLTISDMGSMNNSMGMGGGMGGDMQMTMPTENGGTDTDDGTSDGETQAAEEGAGTVPEGMEMPEGMTVPEGTEVPEGMTMPEDMEVPDDMTMPDASSEEPNTDSNTSQQENKSIGAPSNGMGQSSTNPSALVALSVSAIALIAGLLFAIFYKRRK